LATIGSLNLDISANSAALMREIAKSNSAINNFARQAQQQTNLLTRGFNAATAAARTLAAAIPVLAVAAAATALTSGIRSAIAFGDALSDLAQQTGVSTKQLQELRFAATQTGGSAEALDRGGLVLGQDFIDSADRASDSIASLQFAIEISLQGWRAQASFAWATASGQCRFTPAYQAAQMAGVLSR
jgi:hypothetical protein